MRLFRFEMKKMLLNKKSLILLAVLFIIYLALGFFLTLGNTRADDNQAYRSTYFALTDEHSGKFDAEQLKESSKYVNAAIERYGDGDSFQNRVAVDPNLRFHSEYVQYGNRVNEYWNGPDQQNESDIFGVDPLRSKLAELEQRKLTETFEYGHYQKRLNTELEFGEPVFKRITFWYNYLLIFEGMFIFFLLLMVIVYFIAPLFTQEVKTDMDSILLCSLKGRREIVSSKLLSAALTSAVIVITYVLGFAAGLLLGFRDLSGIDAPLRSLPPLQHTSLDMTVGGGVLLSVFWLIFAGMVFGIFLAFMSTRAKNQSAVMGLGIAVLVLCTSIDMLPQTLKSLIWPITDFNFVALTSFNVIFGGEKVYNFLEKPLPYGAMAFPAGILIILVSCALAYFCQKKRSVT